MGFPMAETNEGGPGSRIRAAREALGLTQGGLAERVGVSRSAVAQWETDRSGQIRANLTRISAALGVSVGFLVTGEGSRPPDQLETSEERALLALYRQIHEGGRADLLRAARRLVALQASPRE
jgi:transcriptional regulator with XRE-family HTH domain